MKIVVDTNILFSLFKKDSFTRELIKSYNLLLISPQVSLEELRKYPLELAKKSGLSEESLELAFSELNSAIKFIPLEEYSPELKNALRLCGGLSEKELAEFFNDIDFFALALKEKCAIWTKDKLFKKQRKIKVFETNELAEYLRKQK
jgi:predicted nucleic acid-binding protein